MDYNALFTNLDRNPPQGWDIIKHPRAGVYLWPKHISRIIRPSGRTESILADDLILFEFHVSEGGYARILARAYFSGKKPKDDFRWRTWHDIAVYHCHAKEVGDGQEPKHTKSVALWDGGALQRIALNSRFQETAKNIKSYLRNQPLSLTCFIGHL